MSTAVVESNLAKLAEEINRVHREAEEALNAGLARAFRAGELLAQAKSQCKHGTWIPWLENNFAGSVRTAQAYMRVVDRREEIESKSAGLAHLGFEEAMQLTTEPKVGPEKPHTKLDQAALDRLDKGVIAGLEDVEIEEFEKILAAIPELSSDKILVWSDDDAGCTAHFEPCPTNDGYFYLLVCKSYASFKAGGQATYDRRPAQYTRTMLAMNLMKLHHVAPDYWVPTPAAEGFSMVAKYPSWFETTAGGPA